VFTGGACIFWTIFLCTVPPLILQVSLYRKESSISISFLGGSLKLYGRGYGFLSGFPPFSFTVYSKMNCRNFKGTWQRGGFSGVFEEIGSA
jgi:hypothetical protein